MHTEGENSAPCRCQLMGSEPPEMAAAPGSGPRSFPLRRSNTCISGRCSWSLGTWAHSSSSWITGVVRALQWVPLPLLVSSFQNTDLAAHLQKTPFQLPITSDKGHAAWRGRQAHLSLSPRALCVPLPATLGPCLGFSNVVGTSGPCSRVPAKPYPSSEAQPQCHFTVRLLSLFIPILPKTCLKKWPLDYRMV